MYQYIWCASIYGVQLHNVLQCVHACVRFWCVHVCLWCVHLYVCTVYMYVWYVCGVCICMCALSVYMYVWCVHVCVHVCVLCVHVCACMCGVCMCVCVSGDRPLGPGGWYRRGLNTGTQTRCIQACTCTPHIGTSPGKLPHTGHRLHSTSRSWDRHTRICCHSISQCSLASPVDGIFLKLMLTLSLRGILTSISPTPSSIVIRSYCWHTFNSEHWHFPQTQFPRVFPEHGRLLNPNL